MTYLSPSKNMTTLAQNSTVTKELNQSMSKFIVFTLKTGKKTFAKKKAKTRNKLQPPNARAVIFDG